MKPAPFAYYAPTTTEEALALLGEHGYDAKLLAGGQSLVPTMNFRLAQPAALIDLNRIASLFYVHEQPAGGLTIGAMTRQRTLERSAAVAHRAPLLHAAMPWIAHVQIRNRGTIGGSLAHADPAAELPAVAVALDARFHIRSIAGERWIAARDFYLGLFTTDLAPDEMLAEIETPALPPRTGCAFEEFARRLGDYALAGCAATVTLDEGGRCTDARLVYFSVGEVPVSVAATAALHGAVPSSDGIAEVVGAAAAEIEPTGDIHASADFRRHLAGVLGRRALTRALHHAQEAA